MWSTDPDRDVVDRVRNKPTSGGVVDVQQEKGSGSVERALTPDHAGNVVGVDPHKRSLSATVVDGRGGLLAGEHFRVSGDGHRALEPWARQFGPIARWGIEGASSWGRHTAVSSPVAATTCGTCARTARPGLTAPASTASPTRWTRSGSRGRRSRTRCCPGRSSVTGKTAGPDECHELLALWHNQRRSILASRQHLVNEAENMLCELPLELREQLPGSKAVRPRLAALADRNRRRRYDRPTALRLRLLDEYRVRIAKLDADEKAVRRELSALVRASGSTLEQLCGRSTRSVAELLVEVGDPRRFTEGGFARFNATAPLAASTAEGPGEPVRHRYNPGGNRRVNTILHMMAVTQLRCEPRAQAGEGHRCLPVRGPTRPDRRRLAGPHHQDQRLARRSGPDTEGLRPRAGLRRDHPRDRPLSWLI